MLMRIRQLLWTHWVPCITAVGIGILAVLPQFLFIGTLGERYQGIPMLQTPNEMAYLGIMQEVKDGYPKASSVPFLEYKQALPILPATLAIPYAYLSVWFNTSLVTILLVSKFVLPATLFLLIYALIFQFAGPDEKWRKLQALSVAVFVLLGFDLVDYRSIFDFLVGSRVPSNLLIWTRPVNPISGALLLFSFLLCLWTLHQERKRWTIPVAGVLLALMMGSYVFSWTLALAILGLLGVYTILRKEKEYFASLCVIGSIGVIVSGPYWYMVYRASLLPGYAEATSRIGLFSTHAPHLNKFAVVSFILFLALTFWKWRKDKQYRIESWWLFSFVLILSSLIAYNQQVITGKEIWYYHYVFYTIPFCFIAVSLAFWHFVRPYFPRFWMTLTCVIIVASGTLGAYTQWAPYHETYAYHAQNQRYATLFSFLNLKAPKDCVVFPNSLIPPFDTSIPAFTHCNMYISGERLLIAPTERFTHNYLAWLRLRGITVDEIDDYLRQNRPEAMAYLYFQNQYSLGAPDLQFEALYAQLPERYRAFLKQDFRTILSAYRLDYILAVTPLSPSVRSQLGDMRVVYEMGGVALYAFQD